MRQINDEESQPKGVCDAFAMTGKSVSVSEHPVNTIYHISLHTYIHTYIHIDRKNREQDYINKETQTFL